MIGTELVRELVETVILTGKLHNCDPVSLLLVAAPESGKTSIVLDRPCKAIEAFSDITGRGIHQVLKDKGKDLTHIVINDMVACVSHRQSVNRYTMSQLNAMTEEGITSLATPGGVERFEYGRKGVIASLTLDLTKDSRHWWNKIGLTTRMLPFCYYYPADLKIQIKDAIDSSRGLKSNGQVKPKEFRVPKTVIRVTYSDSKAKEIRSMADFRSAYLKEVGMRRLKQYHALVQAHALLRNRNRPTVNDQDIYFMKRIDSFISYEEPQPL